MQALKPFSLLIKPVSADCNLQCTYCFYLSRRLLYPYLKKHRMSHNTLELMIKRYLSTRQSTYVFCWQGGEPTLIGVDFYSNALDLQRKWRPPGSVVINTLQTNAVLIGDPFAKFLAESKFLVGVSLDGPSYIHDAYRKNRIGNGSHQAVLRGIECLRRNDVEFNILTMVTRANANNGKEVYSYFKEHGFFHQQYIPCVELEADGRPTSFTITAEAWGNFLCEVYDNWVENDSRTVSVRLFDSIIAYLVTGTHDNCQMATDCCQYYVIEYNGDVYPCDFFVDPPLKLGNIRNNTWENLANSNIYRNFGEEKSNFAALCKNCEHLPYCSGGCLKHRVCGEGQMNRLSWLCNGWKQFYRHAMPGFVRMANWLRMEITRASA